MALKVFYIGGAGRSGSTLLSMILGNLPGFFAAGEVVDFWEHAGIYKIRCGCGDLLSECPVWSEVIAKVETTDSVSLKQIYQHKIRFDRTRHLPFIKLNKTLRQNAQHQYIQALGFLYRNIYKIVGDQTIVDTSKTPVHLYYLSKIPDIDIRVLHLVRDPRAVAYSWKKRTKRDPANVGNPKTMAKRSYINSIIRWRLENRYIEYLGKKQKAYHLLKYEDFIVDPFDTLKQALNEMGYLGIDDDLKILTNDDFRLHQTHSVGGNPMRFTEITTINKNTAWNSEMTPIVSYMLGMLAQPLIKQYHYKVFTNSDLSGKL